MTEGLSDKLKAQIDEILAKKFPEQGGLDLTKLRDKVIKRLGERLPCVLAALVLQVIVEAVDEELGKVGKSNADNHLPSSYYCECCKQVRAWRLCLYDYPPPEEE